MVEDKLLRRKELLQLRRAMTREQVQASSALVSSYILASEAYGKAQYILGYLAFGKELSVDAVLKQALKDGKQVFVPRIVSATEFVAARLADFSSFSLDRYGIRSVPAAAEAIEPERLDLILVPGVAFSKNGGRMGMGAGYYDRYLPQASQAKLMGVAYEELLQETLPLDEHDVLMPCLVTEKGFIKVNNN